MRLRRLIMATVAVLLALGLLVAGWITYSSLRSYLYGRLDAQLDAAQVQTTRSLHFLAHHARKIDYRTVGARISPDVYLVVVDPAGRIILSVPSGGPLHPDPVPILPSPIRTERGIKLTFNRSRGTYRPNPDAFEMRAVGASGEVYRASAFRVPQGIAVVAVTVASTEDTLHSLVKVELAASLAIIAVGAALGAVIVRRELKPLEDMTHTAGAIARGDLAQRVPEGSEHSEVGRLGSALNGMLTQIQAAFDEKSRSERNLRRFIADASHELRTPLTSIRGYTELLRKGAFGSPDAAERALSRVEEEARRMGVMVEEMLLLARLDQGRPLEHEPVELASVCADAVEAARAVDPGRPISLAVRTPAVVSGDGIRLRQVVDNLLRNAITHTPPGTPVTVEVEEQGHFGQCRVCDEGPGIPPEIQSRVFDRFTRGDAARTGQSTGLGLAIVHAIAEALGGRATVASEPGKGACFTLSIPLVHPGSEPPTHAAQRGPVRA